MDQLQLVVTIDGLSSRALGPYGNHWIPTPFFNQLASSGTAFDFFFAESDDHQANLRAMVSQSHVLDQSLNQSLTIKKDRGWDLLITDDEELNEAITEQFDSVATIASEQDISGENQYELLLGFAFTQIEAWTNQAESSSGRIWIHSRGLFSKWTSPAEVQNLFKDESDPEPVQFDPPPSLVLDNDFDPDKRLSLLHAYAAEIVEIDRSVGEFFDAIEDLIPKYSIEFIIAGVRGYALGEHFEVGECGHSFFGEKLQVPLIKHKSDQVPSRETAIRSSHQFQSCLGHSPDAQPLDDENSVVISAGKNFGRIQTRAWSYIHPLSDGKLCPDASGKLFAKPGDSLEINEVSEVCPETAEAMQAELERQIAAFRSGEYPSAINSNLKIFEFAN